MQRFLSLDPLAATFSSWSPYNYVMGNPISLVDPDGRAPEGWSDDNIELANRFGLFGKNEETFDDRYGNEEYRSVKSLRKAKLTVTNQIVGRAYVSGYSHGNGRTEDVFEVPLYKMLLEGTDKNGDQQTREFSVIRFGILQNKTGGPASVVGLADRQSYTIGQWRGNYLDGLDEATPGAWRIRGGHLLHDGADDPTKQAWGAIGCVEVCGNNGFARLNWLIRSWTGTTKFGEKAYEEITRRGLLQIHFEKSKRPPLVPVEN